MSSPPINVADIDTDADSEVRWLAPRARCLLRISMLEEVRLPELPTGTVTFMITDLASSTRLWEEQPDGLMSEALAQHDAIMQETVAQRRGILIASMGDGIAAVFGSVSDALAAAVDIQRDLTADNPGPLLRARVALHSDEGRLRAPGEYVNRPINRCSRLMGVAHGGQVLVSETAAVIGRDALPPGASLVDLGEHRLRDLSRPMRVFQLTHPGLPHDFPPLRSLEALPSNLPVERTTLVGRSRECVQVADLLTQRRLVTLTGVGGVGKTRLALHVGADSLDRFTDGVWLVALATVREPGMVPSAVAGVLGVPEQSGRTTTSVLTDAIGSRSMLLILDNCEHLLDASARLADALLDACPHLSILATSREALAVEGEQSWPTPSLRVPDPEEPTVDDVAQAQAVELFVDRARGARPDFELTRENAADVAALCSRLDGIPLAIELAAARVSALTPRDILDRIDQRFVLLTGGSRTAMERHQTLQAAVAWSYDLLDPAERYVFDRLSVFAGGFTLDAAHAVAAAAGTSEIEVLDVLASLVNKSMVLADGSGASARFRLLETLRQFARDRLAETDDMRAVREAHARYFLALCESFELGPDEDHYRDVMNREIDNIRAAFDWFAEQGDAEMGLRCVSAMRGVFLDAAESFRRTGRALRLVSEIPPAEQVDPLAVASYLAMTAGDYTRATELADTSITSARDAGIPAPTLAYCSRGLAAFWHNDPVAAVRDLEESVDRARAADDGTARTRGELTGALMQLGFVLGQVGESARAIAVGEKALEMARARHSGFQINASQWNLAMACIGVDRNRAAKLIEECLSHDYVRTSTTRLWQLTAYAQIQLATGDYVAAVTTLRECFTVARRLGDRSVLPSALLALARVLRRLEQPTEAARALGASEGQRALIGVPGGPADTRARQRLEAQLRETLGDPSFSTEYQTGQSYTREELLAFATRTPIDAGVN